MEFFDIVSGKLWIPVMESTECDSVTIPNGDKGQTVLRINFKTL